MIYTICDAEHEASICRQVCRTGTVTNRSFAIAQDDKWAISLLQAQDDKAGTKQERPNKLGRSNIVVNPI